MECRTWRTWRLDERWFTQIFCSRKGAEVAKDSYGVQGLAAWRETLMIHARGFIFSQRRGGRKGFLWNAGLGGLGGLARDFND